MSDVDKQLILGRDTPCESRQEIQEWLKFYLDVDLPDQIVDVENSNCTPLDMVWMIYESALYTQKLQNALFIANRAGSKTFDAAVIEFLLLQHDFRDITHIGAIEKQAKRAYTYFQQFYQKPMFKEFVDKMVMEKTHIKGRGSLEILPCSLAAVNGPHTPFVCVSGETFITIVEPRDLTKHIRIRAKTLHYLLSKGFKFDALTFNIKKNQLEKRPILLGHHNGQKEVLNITLVNGEEIFCTKDHKLFIPILNGFKKARDILPNEVVLVEHLNELTEVKVFSISGIFNSVIDVYDFTIEGNHNYFANNILVHNCMDEIDTVQDLQAYKDILGIPIPTKDGRPPIKIGISTRKTIWGLVQQQIDQANKTGLQVFQWGILEVTQRCPDSRSGTQRIPIYVNIERMEALPKQEWDLLSDKQKTEYTFYEGYVGCLTNCKIFPACRGHLKNQKCKSPYLRSIDFIQQQLLEVSAEWALAQHLCLKPSPQGQIYSNFKPHRSIKSYKEMIEIYLGQEIKTNRPVTLEDLVTIFEGKGLTATMGVDFGFTDPYCCLLMYIDPMDNIYVVKELAVTGQDGAEMALYLKENWLAKYKIEIVYPDIESPSNIKLLRKAGFTCAGAKKDEEAQGAIKARYVNKDVKGGIETVRRFIKVPGRNETKLFISPDCTHLLESIVKYHYVVDKFGNIKSDEPDHEFSDIMDALRYALHSIYGHKTPETHLDVPEEDMSYVLDPNSRLVAPTPTELGLINQIAINDNSDEYEELKKKLEAQRQIKNHLGVELKPEDEDDNDSDGFSFAF